MAIELGLKQPETPTTIAMYINDAIGYGMTPEQILFVNEVAFGTADAITYRDLCLRIFDLKTGINEADMRQLKVYAAYFCLNYDIRPFDIVGGIDLRIYQNDAIKAEVADPDEIFHIMRHTLDCTNYLRLLQKEEAGL